MAQRRGFDSLVQMSAGSRKRGCASLASDRPTPLPVQALDHATGYMMATAAVFGLANRLKSNSAATPRLRSPAPARC